LYFEKNTKKKLITTCLLFFRVLGQRTQGSWAIPQVGWEYLAWQEWACHAFHRETLGCSEIFLWKITNGVDSNMLVVPY
jgi:hypothetical protein